MCGKFLYVTTTPLISAKGLVQITRLPDVFLPVPSCHSHDFTFMRLPVHQIWSPPSLCSSTFVRCDPSSFLASVSRKFQACVIEEAVFLCDTKQLYVVEQKEKEATGCTVARKCHYFPFGDLAIPEVWQQAHSCPTSLFSFSWQSSSPSYLVWPLGSLHHTLQAKDPHWVISNL